MVAALVPRRYVPEDASALTSLLNQAYSELAARGLNFTAATQDVSTTRRRVGEGACWVVEHDGVVAATLTMSVPPPSDVQLLTPAARRPDTAWIGQIAVASALRGRAAARTLFDTACSWARGEGVTVVGLDTAVPAEHLAAMYGRWGFESVDTVHFFGKNYDSVVMTRRLTA